MAEGIRFSRPPSTPDLPLGTKSTTDNCLTIRGNTIHSRIERIASRMPPSTRLGLDGKAKALQFLSPAQIMFAVAEIKPRLYRDRETSLEFRVCRSAVIALTRVLHHKLPICSFHQDAFVRHFRVIQLIRSD